MACNGCGTSAGLTKGQVENLISTLIDEGKLQAGLKDCDGAVLPKGSKLVLCSAFADMVQELIDNGKIDVVKEVKVEDGKIVVVDGTGKETKLATPFVSDLAFDATTNKLTWSQNGKDKEAVLPYVKAVAGDKGVVLTLPNGTTIEVPKAGLTDGLAGSGLTANNGQLSVATVRLMDASGTVHLGNLVDVTK